jgi:hypothetical protein
LPEAAAALRVAGTAYRLVRAGTLQRRQPGMIAAMALRLLYLIFNLSGSRTQP